MQRVLILGAGGHAQVVADILLRAGEAGAAVEPLGYLDDNPLLTGQFLLGLPVLGRMADLGRVAHDALVVAIGGNATRRRLFESLQKQGEQFTIARHPSAIIAPDVQIGQGVMVCAGVIINPGCTIGANAILNTGCTIDHHNRIGDHTHIAPGVHLGGEVQISEGGFVGIGAIVMPQRRVGSWSVVGAGAVVHRDIPTRVVAAGVPARVIESLQSTT
jgi:sugar O-acyltransferase (sialic acid O-acetyltransferase NeuD family)